MIITVAIGPKYHAQAVQRGAETRHEGNNYSEIIFITNFRQLLICVSNPSLLCAEKLVADPASDTYKNGDE